MENEHKIVIKTDEEVVDTSIKTGDGKTDDVMLDGKSPEEIAAAEVESARLAKLAKEDLEGSEGSDDDSDDDDSDAVNSIIIDDITYTLDDNGNAIKEDGTVGFTKEQITEFEANSEGSNVSKLMESTKIIPLDETGKPVEYTNDEEGLSNYVADVYEQARRDETTNVFNSLYSKFPVLKNVISHLELNNGNFDNFSNTVSYTDVKIDSKNEEQMKNIIFEARKARGESAEKIDKYYKYLKDSDTDLKAVKAEANDELSYLQQAEADRLENDNRLLAEREAKNIEDSKNYWGVDVDDSGKLVNLNKEGSIYNAISSGKIKLGDETYTIPDKIRVKVGDKVEYKTRLDFFKYVYEPVKQVVDGQRVTQTLHSTDMASERVKRTNNDDVFDAFKRFVKYDTSQFIKEKVNQSKVDDIKRLRSTGGKNSTSNKKPVVGQKVIIKI